MRQIEKFTFQYGSIQMLRDAAAQMTDTTFTFQYGSIQIVVVKKAKNCRIKFTFQYGSIQIKAHRPSCNLPLIYIPIWFYSNVNK